MSEPTIEEAWAALEFRQGDGPQEQAARALALAVLEEASCTVVDEVDRSGDLRERIKKLGRA